MPKLNKIQTSRIKKARSASQIRHSSPKLRTRRQTWSHTDLEIPPSQSCITPHPLSSFQRVPNVDKSEPSLFSMVYQQYRNILPRIKSPLFRLQVLRHFFYFRNVLKFSRKLSLFHTCKANLIGESTLELWLKNFRETGSTEDFQSDKTKGPIPIFDSDELALLDDFIIKNSISIGDQHPHTGCALTVKKIIEWVEVELAKTVSETTIRRVLNMLDFRWSDSSVPDARSSYNKIGHDRPDVVQYRQETFLDRSINVLSCQRSILICQDESMFSCNMHSPYFYVKFDENGKKWASSLQKRQAQKKTSRGKTYSVMVAGYMTRYGFLKETLKTIKRGGIYGHKSYSSSEFLRDFVDAIKICRQKFPDKKLVFLFDNAPSHKIKLPGISAESVPTWNSNGQSLPSFPYSSKEEYLKSRNLWKPDFELDSEPPKPTILISEICSHIKPSKYRTLAHWRTDLQMQWKIWKSWERQRKEKEKLINAIFLNSVTWKNFATQVEEIARKHQVTILFTPFYHAELNPIELIWGRLKQQMRYHQLSSIKSISDKLPEFIDRINHDGFCKKAFKRVIARIVNYKKFGYNKLSYYDYKKLVLSLSDSDDPWSPEVMSTSSHWLLSSE